MTVWPWTSWNYDDEPWSICLVKCVIYWRTTWVFTYIWSRLHGVTLSGVNWMYDKKENKNSRPTLLHKCYSCYIQNRTSPSIEFLPVPSFKFYPKFEVQRSINNQWSLRDQSGLNNSPKYVCYFLVRFRYQKCFQIFVVAVCRVVFFDVQVGICVKKITICKKPVDF